MATKRQVSYGDKDYTVRSNKVDIPDLEAMSRFGALIWLNQNTYATGPRAKPNPLAGLGDALTIQAN